MNYTIYNKYLFINAIGSISEFEQSFYFDKTYMKLLIKK